MTLEKGLYFIGAVFEAKGRGSLSLHPLGVQFARPLPMFCRSFIDGLHQGPGTRRQVLLHERPITAQFILPSEKCIPPHRYGHH